jgi:lysophospholipase L1-like esterase
LPFLQRLFIQRVSGGERIQIVHIGDSHILGNFMTHETRVRMQNAFGDAGRGLVFPYKLAGSNGPRDFTVETNSRWIGNNCQRDQSPVSNYGISGFSLETTTPEGETTIHLRDSSVSHASPFTKVTVFYRKAPDAFDFELFDDQTNQTARRLIEDDFSSTFFFDRPVSQFSIQHKQVGEEQKRIQIDGFCIENELSGIVYHSIGVNGARYLDFARTRLFAPEIAKLNPDLIIISMGTNEAQGESGPKGLYQQMHDLITQIQTEAPGVPILLTTPADSYLRRKGFNPYMPKIASIIRRYAEEHGLALWDLYSISGGPQSAQWWKSTGLLSRDSVHYTKRGYAAQGKLFYLSLIEEYNHFVEELAREASGEDE